MPIVTMYTAAYCPYCRNAERLLLSHGVQDIYKIRVDLSSEQRIEMMQKTGKRTVPQIYIGEHYIGGFDDLLALDKSHKLDRLLAI